MFLRFLYVLTKCYENQWNTSIFFAEITTSGLPARQTCVGVRAGDHAFCELLSNHVWLQQSSVNVSSESLMALAGRQTCVGVRFARASEFTSVQMQKNIRKRKLKRLLCISKRFGCVGVRPGAFACS